MLDSGCFEPVDDTPLPASIVIVTTAENSRHCEIQVLEAKHGTAPETRA